MKRFKIKNKRTGLEFQVEREVLGGREVEWGRESYVIPKGLADDWEIANGQDAGHDAEGLDLWQVFDAMEVASEVDITDEVTQREAARNAKVAAKRRIREVNWSDVNTVAELKALVKDLVDSQVE